LASGSGLQISLDSVTGLMPAGSPAQSDHSTGILTGDFPMPGSPNAIRDLSPLLDRSNLAMAGEISRPESLQANFETAR